MSTPPFRSYVSISRSRIAANFRQALDAVGPDVTVCGVVKADAYGHGAVEVSRILEQQGATWLAVSSVEEGVTLRRAGRRSRILVMAGFLPYEREALLEYDLTPAAHSLEDIAELEQFAVRAGKLIRYHLKIDSGMGRLGTRAAAEQIRAAIQSAGSARCEGCSRGCAGGIRRLLPRAAADAHRRARRRLCRWPPASALEQGQDHCRWQSRGHSWHRVHGFDHPRSEPYASAEARR